MQSTYIHFTHCALFVHRYACTRSTLRRTRHLHPDCPLRAVHPNKISDSILLPIPAPNSIWSAQWPRGRYHGGWRQSSQSNRHSTIGTRQTEYHEALPSSTNDEVRCDYAFADDGNASWYSVCRVPMVEWRTEYCCYWTVVGLHDTGPRTVVILLSHMCRDISQCKITDSTVLYPLVTTKQLWNKQAQSK